MKFNRNLKTILPIPAIEPIKGIQLTSFTNKSPMKESGAIRRLLNTIRIPYMNATNKAVL